jgi:hypothetical protein
VLALALHNNNTKAIRKIQLDSGALYLGFLIEMDDLETDDNDMQSRWLKRNHASVKEACVVALFFAL